MGARPILYAATAAGIESDACVGPDGFMQRNGYPTAVRTSRRSRDTALAARLRERSEQLTGIRYAIEPLPATPGPS